MRLFLFVTLRRISPSNAKRGLIVTVSIGAIRLVTVIVVIDAGIPAIRTPARPKYLCLLAASWLIAMRLHSFSHFIYLA